MNDIIDGDVPNDVYLLCMMKSLLNLKSESRQLRFNLATLIAEYMDHRDVLLSEILELNSLKLKRVI
jgi:hypothetical protein